MKTEDVGSVRRCSKCGAEVANSMAFCPSCGKKQGEAKTAPAAKSGINKKIAALGGLIVVLVIAIAVVVAVGQKKPDEESPSLELPAEPQETAAVLESAEPASELPEEDEPPEELPTEEETEDALAQEETDPEPAAERIERSFPLVEIAYNGDGEASQKTEYTYDADGNLLKKIAVSFLQQATNNK